MSEAARSMLLMPAMLYVAAAAALLLTFTRPTRAADDATLRIYLLGIAAQCLHFLEEYATGFAARFPPLAGFAPWPDLFFVALNVVCLAMWSASAAGMRANVRIAFAPAWFFAIAMTANGLAHPLLALAARGYFPGLITSPLVGIAGVAMWRRLTRGDASPASLRR